MSVDPEITLKHTNVSQPRLSHQTSQQSVTASLATSEGYYSLSENSSHDSNDRKPLFQSPPSTHRSATSSHENVLNQDAPTTFLKGIGIPRQAAEVQVPAHVHHRAQSPAFSPIPEERPVTQEARRSQLSPNMDSESLATTPGQDATPYIRFAIDQLTRDEEVRGSRIYPEVRPTARREEEDDEDYPVERIIPDDGLGYMVQEQRTQDRMSQYTPKKPERKPSQHNATPRLPMPMTRHPTNPSHRQKQQQPLANGKDVFVASSQTHSPLRFVPAILRPLWLGIFIFICILMLTGLIFSAVYSNRSNGTGFWDYIRFGDSRYFIFEYLPTLVGMLILLWVIQIQIALQRIVPFVSMSSDSFHRRAEAVFLPLHPMQFLIPQTRYFRSGQRRMGVCFVVFWLFTWTVPLLASAFNVRYVEERGAWRYVAVQGVVWTVIVIYIILIITLVVVMLFLMRNNTGLKWDPRSLADIICLLERSNIMSDYDGSETFEKGDWHLVSNRAGRLGHWTTTQRPNDFFYGFGEEGGETRQYSVEDGRIRERTSERPSVGKERHSDFSIRMDIRSPGVRLRYLPWYLKDTSVVAWIVIAVVLLVAFIVLSFLNNAVSLGFLPQVFAQTNSAGFSASNFLYSFIPAIIANFLFLSLLSLDYSIRALQPYISLASTGGATAETSLLLDYSARLPISVTLAALENKHFQTAMLSFASLASAALPILAGGCFWTQYYNSQDTIRVSADLPAYYALCFFVALYALSLFALLPGRRRAALPHASTTLAQTISWLYQSPILTDRAFSKPQTKPELVARLMGNQYLESTWTRSVASLVRPSRSNLRADSPTDPALKEKPARGVDAEPGKIRYGFGIHVGRDGLEHLGIERVRRGGERSGRELVIWEEQRKNKRKSWTEQV